LAGVLSPEGQAEADETDEQSQAGDNEENAYDEEGARIDRPDNFAVELALHVLELCALVDEHQTAEDECSGSQQRGHHHPRQTGLAGLAAVGLLGLTRMPFRHFIALVLAGCDLGAAHPPACLRTFLWSTANGRKSEEKKFKFVLFDLFYSLKTGRQPLTVDVVGVGVVVVDFCEEERTPVCLCDVLLLVRR